MKLLGTAMEIGVAVTNFVHSTKIAFQLWVTQVWSRKLIFKTGLENFYKNIETFFFNLEKEGGLKLVRKKTCLVRDSSIKCLKKIFIFVYFYIFVFFLFFLFPIRK